MIKIYGDLNSGNCLKVKYLCDHLGTPYTWVAVDILGGECRTAEFLAKSIMGQVPVIELENRQTLAQSNAILLYLAEGSAMLPEEALSRAKMNQWLFWEQYSHEPYIAVSRYQMLYLGLSAQEREAWRVEKAEAALDVMQAHLSGRDFFAAEKITCADIALLAYTRLAHEGGFELSSRPNIKSWIDRCETALGLPPADEV